MSEKKPQRQVQDGGDLAWQQPVSFKFETPFASIGGQAYEFRFWTEDAELLLSRLLVYITYISCSYIIVEYKADNEEKYCGKVCFIHQGGETWSLPDFLFFFGGGGKASSWLPDDSVSKATGPFL